MSLADSPAAIMQALLIQSGLFGDPDAVAPLVWPVFDGQLPDDTDSAVPVPDSAAAVFDIPGLANDRLMQQDDAGDYAIAFFYGVQIRVRAQDKSDAWAKIKTATSALSRVSMDSLTVNGHQYTLQDVNQVSAELYLGVEPGTKRRSSYTANFLCTILDGGSSAPFVPPSSTVRFTVSKKTADYHLQVSDAGTLFTNEGASGPVTFFLPPWASGFPCTFEQVAPHPIEVVPQGTDFIRDGGVVSSPGLAGSMTSQNVGDLASLSGDAQNQWSKIGGSGSWDIE